jgi:hypothetical protein
MYYGNFWDYWNLGAKVTFDGTSKLIYVNPDVTALDIRADVYTTWVKWIELYENTVFTFAIEYSGLDPIPGGNTGDIYFLKNGWKLIIDLTKVAVSGVLYSRDYSTAYYSSTLTPQYPATVAALVNTVTNYQNVVTGDVGSIVVPTAQQNADAVIASGVLTKPQFIALK